MVLENYQAAWQFSRKESIQSHYFFWGNQNDDPGVIYPNPIPPVSPKDVFEKSA
jgi:hypothetical protein